jgi:geranylgeranylglycerol-phosphate geranylgeranyltransferase
MRSRPGSIPAYLALARLPETGVAFAASCVGARLATLDPLTAPPVVVLAASNALLFSASVAFNDWHDVAEDAINQPERPVASGRIGPHAALGASAVLLGSALALAAAAGPAFLAAATLLALLSVAYTLRLKRVPVVGNLVVAAVSTYALACWMVVSPPSRYYLLAAAGCACIRLGGELIKTAADAAGDGACRIRTAATIWGVRAASGAGLGAVAAGLVIALAPVVERDANGTYRSLLAASALLVLGGGLALRTSRHGGPSPGALITLERLVTVLMTIAIGLGLPPGWP